MNIKIYLSVVLFFVAGTTTAICQKLAKSQQLMQDLKITREQSNELILQQDLFKNEVDKVLRDTALRPEGRSFQIKSLSKSYGIKIKALLSPIQQKNLTSVIHTRNEVQISNRKFKMKKIIDAVNNRQINRDSLNINLKNSRDL